MKKNKYYKTVPKAWKKKKTAMKRKKPMIYDQNKLIAKQRDKPAALHNLKSLNRRSGTWKMPTILLVSILITIILVIPTLIVLPYMNDDDELTVKNEEAPKEVEISLGDSPFSVAVMRANSDQVENVPLETYVSRVVSGEMPVDFELEALKAQALAARTFIVNHMLHQGASDKSDITDTVNDQVYNNEADLRKKWGSDYTKNMNKIKKAVAATKGQILTYNNAPISPAYFSTSNGYTVNSEDYWENELPYLRSVKSPWDTKSPEFLEQEILSIEQVEKGLGVDLPENITVNMTRSDNHRVREMNIAGKSFTGREVREKLDLRSTDFTMEQKSNHLIFKTKGYGHGIGMSQYGANGMAKEGKSYKDIVKYYYQGVSISDINETAPTLVAK
ncbi:stage II sporulation protein D [Virgibacillus oceani]|uniref:Stage II sporulation protein D n=1 Tax=Virgibacillus oceani TaxID=1479511 RepID=A0A917M9E3_9BACI|nr:stage II sporulation protein D [Virgibacillus oceani]GGG86104.1 stage II sporulation protein D [Virgibacillus oceani]